MAANAIDQRAFRAALAHFPTGVAVVTAATPDGPVGMTLQSFMSLSLDPALIMLAVDRKSTTWPRIKKVGRLAINVLAEDQEDIAMQFACSGGDKFAGVDLASLPADPCPLIRGALTWFDCSIAETHAGGDHTITICDVNNFQIGTTECQPLVFFRSQFPKLASPAAQAV
ncbi:hypothetical protein A5630_15530 [Mycolicibacterium mucogenicum]|uniref:Flavin reductase like domain-containing protein n=1 Tax=Mycolicibacterium mucogenicum TaxID=56689 RepID=A0A1A3HB57_MYCMU|nr:flavin reductase family protein [Mycolicibacterium mucogenicum]OBJ44816.1 hypothetical protein A5630_15530 [Mycolicibacterium mucogenicum]